MAEGAFRFLRAHFSFFANVRRLVIVALPAIQVPMNARQRECGTAVIKVTVAIAACTRDRLVPDRLDDLAAVGQADERVALPAADVFMKQGQWKSAATVVEVHRGPERIQSMALTALPDQLPAVIILVAIKAIGRQRFEKHRLPLSGRESHAGFEVALAA